MSLNFILLFGALITCFIGGIFVCTKLTKKCSSWEDSETCEIIGGLMTILSGIALVSIVIFHLAQTPDGYEDEAILVNNSTKPSQVVYAQYKAFDKSEVKTVVIMPGQVKIFTKIKVISNNDINID